jgi:hypothetical protein
MPAANVLTLSENFDTMTFTQCMGFISRSRRQLERLKHLPNGHGPVDRVEIVSIFKDLDALERSVRSDPRFTEITS